MSDAANKDTIREPYATVQDVITLGRTLSSSEQEKAENLLPLVSDRLRVEAVKVGRDLDKMVEKNPALASVAKGIVVDIVVRCLQAQNSTVANSLSQYSESAMGYSISGTIANPGGGLFVKKAELAALGLKRQRYGVIDFYGID